MKKVIASALVMLSIALTPSGVFAQGNGGGNGGGQFNNFEQKQVQKAVQAARADGCLDNWNGSVTTVRYQEGKCACGPACDALRFVVEIWSNPNPNQGPPVLLAKVGMCVLEVGDVTCF